MPEREPSPHDSKEPQGRRIRALDRGLIVLEALAQGEELPLGEVATRAGLAYSTTHRILETLEHRRFVQQSPVTGMYSIGLRAFAVGSAYVQTSQIPEVARLSMHALVDLSLIHISEPTRRTPISY